MSIPGIQGQVLEVRVVSCTKLKDTEWFSRQDPYVCLEYGSTKYRTGTCTDGDRNPIFQEKFMFTLIEGLRELTVAVWNSNTINRDAFIGSGKVHLPKVLSSGCDDSSWPLQTKTGRHAGEVHLIMRYANATRQPVLTILQRPATYPAISAPRPTAYPVMSALTYVTPSAPPAPMYSTPPPASAAPPVSAALYGKQVTAAPYVFPASAYLYPQPPNPSYPSSSAYSPPPYPPPTSVYPPPPPPSSGLPYGHPGHYPPPPYPPRPY